MLRKYFLLFFFIIVFFMSNKADASSPLIDISDFGTVDWTTGTITAISKSESPAGAVIGKKKTLAKRIAIAYAHRHLASLINNLQVDAQTKVGDYVKSDKPLCDRLNLIIKNSNVQNITENPDGSFDVSLVVHIYGVDGLLNAVSPTREAISESTQKQATAEGFTGLIIDARGINIKPCLDPKISDDLGRPLYGSFIKMNQNYIIQHGVVDYSMSIDDAKKSVRSGPNPLIIRAKSPDIEGGTNIVVSSIDSNNIINENQKSNFLDNHKVVIVL